MTWDRALPSRREYYRPRQHQHFARRITDVYARHYRRYIFSIFHELPHISGMSAAHISRCCQSLGDKISRRILFESFHADTMGRAQGFGMGMRLPNLKLLRDGFAADGQAEIADIYVDDKMR